MSNYILIDGTLYHHGIKGQRWGQRRYQNEDGSLTPEGREHYGYGEARTKLHDAGAGQYIRGLTSRGKAENEKRYAELVRTAKNAEKSRETYKQAKKEYKNSDEYKARKEKMKKAAKIGLAVAGTALAAYGTYKVSQAAKDKAYRRAYELGKDRADLIYQHNGVRGWTTFKDGTITLQNHFGQTMGEYSSLEKRDMGGAKHIAKLVNDAAWEDYMKDMRRVDADAKDVSKNLVSAAKYLYENRKRR